MRITTTTDFFLPDGTKYNPALALQPQLFSGVSAVEGTPPEVVDRVLGGTYLSIDEAGIDKKLAKKIETAMANSIIAVLEEQYPKTKGTWGVE